MINRIAYWITVIALLYAVHQYTYGVVYSLGYRFGYLSLESLPDVYQSWLPQMALWQDVIYTTGYALSLAATGLLLLRRAEALWVIIAGGGLAQLDWILLPFTATTPETVFDYSTFLQYFVLIGLLVFLRQRNVLRRARSTR
ncbi:hypothetical protein [Maricaulis sp.]|uniref:hypothetical protein n=1 Tax=Maricaulis sp. TaxID=1486257 RepID=UPI002B267808|nr:hypothetical protein [Maricaulis sp.]